MIIVRLRVCCLLGPQPLRPPLWQDSGLTCFCPPFPSMYRHMVGTEHSAKWDPLDLFSLYHVFIPSDDAQVVVLGLRKSVGALGWMLGRI